MYVSLVNAKKICVEVLCLMSRTTYTSSSFRVNLKLCRKSEDVRTKTPKIDNLAYHTPKNRLPGVRTPNLKSLTEHDYSR